VRVRRGPATVTGNLAFHVSEVTVPIHRDGKAKWGADTRSQETCQQLDLQTFAEGGKSHNDDSA